MDTEREWIVCFLPHFLMYVATGVGFLIQNIVWRPGRAVGHAYQWRVVSCEHPTDRTDPDDRESHSANKALVGEPIWPFGYMFFLESCIVAGILGITPHSGHK